jgi:hypothetical protein
MNEREEFTSSETPFDKMMRAVRESRLIASGILEEANEHEIPHKHMCRVTMGSHYAIRWCVVPGCMQSWRMAVRTDAFDDEPLAEWEPISEPVDLTSPILPDYEE